ncbi:MAG TPA: NAD-dependent epimerase/dehydratase family protein [Pedomonas sp.]|uniref:NAD-dependent epimerase/dehydratase family protein n=1 Tax=Pedomonas sp. TaxID=2976421 RepID=UPI002F4055FA
MRVLVIGGSGYIGGSVALRLAAMGHDVTVASRRPPAAASAMSGLPFLSGDYVAGDFDQGTLARFDAVVHAAGNDIRQRPQGEDEETHLARANVRGIPDFFRAVRDAGVGRGVYVGSFYPQVVPHRIALSPYIRSRLAADEGVRALATSDFSVCSVNPPYIVGHLEGVSSGWLLAHAAYALGDMPAAPIFAIPGGVNYMSLAAVTDAIIGALEHGEAGRAYLVGDENLSFHDYFGMFRRAAGLPANLPIRNEEHPVLPDWALYAGRGGEAYFEPDARDAARLGYRRGDVGEAIAEVVRAYRQ